MILAMIYVEYKVVLFSLERGNMSFIMTAAITAALAYLGNKQNNDAKQRDESTKLIIDFCNDYIKHAQVCIDERKGEIDRMLGNIAELKSTTIKEVYSEYLRILDENFINFNVVLDVDSSYDKYKALVTLDKIKESIHLFDIINNFTIKDDFIKKSLITSVATIGISSVVTSFSAGGLTSSIMPKISLAGSVPIIIGAGFAVTGILNNCKSKENYQNAIEYFEMTKKFSEEVTELCNSLEKILQHIVDMANLLRSMVIDFAYAVGYIFECIENPYSEFYSSKENKLDAKYLDLDSKKMLKNLYLISQVLYASFDLPLLTTEGVIDLDARTTMYSNVNDCSDIKMEFDA